MYEILPHPSQFSLLTVNIFTYLSLVRTLLYTNTAIFTNTLPFLQGPFTLQLHTQQQSHAQHIRHERELETHPKLSHLVCRMGSLWA